MSSTTNNNFSIIWTIMLFAFILSLLVVWGIYGIPKIIQEILSDDTQHRTKYIIVLVLFLLWLLVVFFNSCVYYEMFNDTASFSPLQDIEEVLVDVEADTTNID